ncbi:MAG: hypothetical protein ACRC1N_20225, partial [Aeromonas sobria]
MTELEQSVQRKPVVFACIEQYRNRANPAKAPISPHAMGKPRQHCPMMVESRGFTFMKSRRHALDTNSNQ